MALSNGLTVPPGTVDFPGKIKTQTLEQGVGRKLSFLERIHVC